MDNSQKEMIDEDGHAKRIHYCEVDEFNADKKNEVEEKFEIVIENDETFEVKTFDLNSFRINSSTEESDDGLFDVEHTEKYDLRGFRSEIANLVEDKNINCAHASVSIDVKPELPDLSVIKYEPINNRDIVSDHPLDARVNIKKLELKNSDNATIEYYNGSNGTDCSRLKQDASVNFPLNLFKAQYPTRGSDRNVIDNPVVETSVNTLSFQSMNKPHSYLSENEISSFNEGRSTYCCTDSLNMFINSQFPDSGYERDIMDIPVITPTVKTFSFQCINKNESYLSDSEFHSFLKSQTIFERPFSFQQMSSSFIQSKPNLMLTSIPLFQNSSSYNSFYGHTQWQPNHFRVCQATNHSGLTSNDTFTSLCQNTVTSDSNWSSSRSMNIISSNLEKFKLPKTNFNASGSKISENIDCKYIHDLDDKEVERSDDSDNETVEEGDSTAEVELSNIPRAHLFHKSANNSTNMTSIKTCETDWAESYGRDILTKVNNKQMDAVDSSSEFSYNYVLLDGILSLNLTENTTKIYEESGDVTKQDIDDVNRDLDSERTMHGDINTPLDNLKSKCFDEISKVEDMDGTRNMKYKNFMDLNGCEMEIETGIKNVNLGNDDKNETIENKVDDSKILGKEKLKTNKRSNKKKVLEKRLANTHGAYKGIRYKIVKRCVLARCTGFTMQSVMLRVKERKTYADHELDDDDIEGKRLYKIEDKLASDKYNKDYVKKLLGEEFNLRYLQENGLQYPIIFMEKTGLGLRVPSDNFKVSDVKACVGSRRMLDVMDVNTQKGLEMTMKEWTRYYEETNRDRLLNVISLEFSHTKLENYVESPNLVREVDWVDTAWPQHLKDCQTESTNAIDKMKYPKVQKYCLMSVAGCYTDFHIDFGGTSVWYHILHGEKVFWLIPPTDKNLAKYENWVLSGKQGDAFLADSIEECQMLHLVAGNTFIIPSGWIHAVYTPKDSLVFGGNFLHSFNMVNQLKVAGIEDKTHVPMKFRYPFYAEINWYVLERYVHSLTGVTYLEKPQLNDDLEVISTKMDSPGFDMLEEKLNKRLSVSLTRIDDTSPRRKSSSDDDSVASGPTRSPGQASTQRRTGRKSSSESSNSLDLKAVEKTETPKVPYKSPVKRKTKYVHLTKYELEGLIEVVAWVESLPASKKGIPKDLIDPDTVINEVKRLIQEHMRDNPELAITGEPVLEWTKATKKLIKLKQKVKTAKLLGTHCAPKVRSAGGKTASGNRHRRVRCKRCEPCTRDDCMECNFCKDMRKYGGPGRAKQSCISRQCLAPILPKGISCLQCNQQVCPIEIPVKTDGASDDDAEEFSTSLMECGLCWEIVHPACLQRNNENYKNEGILNEDLPNSWKCSKCCFAGKEGKLMTRVFKGGWRPNTASTPPPLSVSPPPQPQSPAGDLEVMVTEGKRVTVNQALDSKHTMMPKLSPSVGFSDVDTKPGKLEPLSDTEPSSTKPATLVPNKLKSEDQMKLEPGESTTVSNGSGEVTGIKRSGSPLQDEPFKKKRNVSSVPSKITKPAKTGTMVAKSSQKKSQKSSTPDVQTKRSKRETTPRNVGRCTFDFDDDEELMDVSAPLPEKNKGKSPKGKKNVHIKQKTLGATFTNDNNGSKVNKNSLEMKKEDVNLVLKKTSDKMSNDELKRTLIEHIEKRNLPIIKPQFAVRPAPISPPDDYFITISGQKHPLSRKLWTKVFAFLLSGDLARCQAVCKVWNRWCINPDLWKKIDLSKQRIVQTHLMGIVRRQPEYLNLSSVIMTQKQILWLLERIPLLKTLIMSKCSWATISGLCMSSCPLLYKLDVSWATGLNDKCFEDLITPPVDRKPAVKNISRLHRLKSLHLSGTEVTDASLELMTIHLSQLEELNISYCTRVMDRGIKMLASSKSATQDSLKCLNISGCRGLTEVSVEAIRNLSSLEELYAVNCIRIPVERCKSLRMQQLKVFKF